MRNATRRARNHRFRLLDLTFENSRAMPHIQGPCRMSSNDSTRFGKEVAEVCPRMPSGRSEVGSRCSCIALIVPCYHSHFEVCSLALMDQVSGFQRMENSRSVQHKLYCSRADTQFQRCSGRERRGLHSEKREAAKDKFLLCISCRRGQLIWHTYFAMHWISEPFLMAHLSIISTLAIISRNRVP